MSIPWKFKLSGDENGNYLHALSLKVCLKTLNWNEIECWCTIKNIAYSKCFRLKQRGDCLPSILSAFNRPVEVDGPSGLLWTWSLLCDTAVLTFYNSLSGAWNHNKSHWFSAQNNLYNL